jgi:hypothetical protein
MLDNTTGTRTPCIDAKYRDKVSYSACQTVSKQQERAVLLSWTPTGADLKRSGLATHFVPSASLPSLEEELDRLGPRAASQEEVDAVLRLYEVRICLVLF